MKNIIKCSLLVPVFFVVGCGSQPTTLTRINLQKLDQYETLPREAATANGFALFGIIPIRMTSRESRVRTAILQKSGGEDIIEPSISSGYIWTPVGSVYRFRMEATPIKKKNTYARY